MKILVIGKGGREHALAYAANRSKKVKQVYVAPGNTGMQDVAKLVDINDSDIEGLVAFAKKENIDLTIVGPESALSLGVVDAFQKEGLKIFGPNQAAAQVESSKDFAKKMMAKYDIPTAEYKTFNTKKEAKEYVESKGAPIVIKEDGLKAGKGVTVATTIEEAYEALDIAFDIPNNKVVIEECLVGFEFSLMTFVCDDLVIPMEIAQDHKTAYEDDKGPNTGGMGAYSPVKTITPEIIDEAMEKVMIPMAKAMKKEGVPFTGFLYGGMMLTKEGVKTIEFNARFGDPEAEVILPRLESDFIEVIESVMNKQDIELIWKNNVTVGVVMASTNYPQSSTKDAIIKGIEDVETLVFHMGTAKKNNELVTAGGRVLVVVGEAKTLEEAYAKAYKEIKKIKCDDLFYRNDIGKKDMA
ncbi:MAG: phosphoribosylamine--glycine ligase [Erysipelotrichaceae bacterium]